MDGLLERTTGHQTGTGGFVRPQCGAIANAGFSLAAAGRRGAAGKERIEPSAFRHDVQP